MQIPITGAETQNLIFLIIFLGALVFSARKFQTTHSFTPALTEELKGLAILAVVFSHIGYFLVSDNKFLFPLSTIAGVGVNLFLFLSGMGLTFSSLKSASSILGFYKKRLLKLFLPMWIVFTFFLLTDYFFLHLSYPTKTIIQGYFGFFPAADLFKSVNSPLWYFTLILFYYLLFPLVFNKKWAYATPLIVLVFSYWLLKQPFLLTYVDENVANLYKTHFVSFPLGIFFAILIQEKVLGIVRWHVKNIFLRSHLKYLLIPLFVGVFAYTSINSGVGLDKEIEQTISLITMFSILFIFIAKNIEFKLFHIFGKYSYEIYLLHWPLLARYDIFYHYLPASVGTVIYLVEFLFLAWLIQKGISNGLILLKKR